MCCIVIYVITNMYNFNPPPRAPFNAFAQKNLPRGVNKFTILTDPSLVCPRVEEKRRRNITFSLYDLYGHVLAQNPCYGAIRFTIFVNSSFVINTILSVCQIYASEYRISKKWNHSFSLFDLYGHSRAKQTLNRGHEIWKRYMYDIHFELHFISMTNIPCHNLAYSHCIISL